MFSGFKQLLFFDTVFPAAEKTLSAAVDVAGTHNMDLASLLMLGNLGSFTFHHSNTLVLLPGGLSCKYMSISSSTVKELLVSSGPSKMSKADFFNFLHAGISPSEVICESVGTNNASLSVDGL